MAAAVLNPIQTDQQAAGCLLTIEEYLRTSYRPDLEYIDGELLERNVGQWEHSRIQYLISGIFLQREAEWGVFGATEQRTRVADTKVRIPDVVIVPATPQPAVTVQPPLLIVEILSPDDTYADTQRRATEYTEMGVRAIWIIDPETRTGRQCVGDAWTAAAILKVPETPIELDLTDLFRRLDASPRL